MTEFCSCKFFVALQIRCFRVQNDEKYTRIEVSRPKVAQKKLASINLEMPDRTDEKIDLFLLQNLQSEFRWWAKKFEIQRGLDKKCNNIFQATFSGLLYFFRRYSVNSTHLKRQNRLKRWIGVKWFCFLLNSDENIGNVCLNSDFQLKLQISRNFKLTAKMDLDFHKYNLFCDAAF